MADEELKKKKKIRGGHKGYVTTTLEKVHGLLDNFELSAANQVKTYRIALTEKLDILGALYDEILTLTTEENIEDEISETGIFLMLILTRRSRLVAFITWHIIPLYERASRQPK